MNERYDSDLWVLLNLLSKGRTHYFRGFNTGTETHLNIQMEDSTFGSVDVIDLYNSGAVGFTFRQEGAGSPYWNITTEITDKGLELLSLLDSQEVL